MTQIVIAQYARTAFQPAHKGLLTKTRPDDMAAAVVSAVVERAGVDPATVEDVILGNATPEGEQGLLMGRLVALRAGFPKEVGGATINRWCGSSMSAIHYAAGQIAMGAGDAFVAAGVESMTRVPMGGFNPMPNAQLMADVQGVYMGMVRRPRSSPSATSSAARHRKPSPLNPTARQRPPTRPASCATRSSRSTASTPTVAFAPIPIWKAFRASSPRSRLPAR